MKKLILVIATALLLTAPLRAELFIVKDGKSLAPIIIFKDAPPYIRGAADELAVYIEKVSGAKPEVIEGKPDPLPENAIWVGFQPVMKEIFPKLNFDFEYPEEIMIAANGKHLVIAGRDIWDPEGLNVEGKRVNIVGKQSEYGTANAVYTFIQDYLDVRWIWPGESGEDIIEKKTIAFKPFEYRYHPKFRSRSGLLTYSTLGQKGRSKKWSLHQRLLLDSLPAPGGHAFTSWYKRFHKTKPELFALQPDETRSGWPGPYDGNKIGGNAKVCQSNPEVWKQWLADVEEQLKKDPSKVIFNASPNDGASSGSCVCKNCKSLDPPAGETPEVCRLNWHGSNNTNHVPLSDRYVTFANRLAKILKQRFPNKDYQVLLHAYGIVSRPAPVSAIPADNVIISFVPRFPWCDEKTEKEQRGNWLRWTKIGAGKMIFRPNTGSRAGWAQGLPEVLMSNTIETFKFLYENNCVGVFVDAIHEHWATHAPQYYMMGQLTWNPELNGQLVLEDYYNRGFGPASEEIKAYWTQFEKAGENFISCQADEDWNKKYNFKKMYSPKLLELYTPELLNSAEKLLNEAAVKVLKDSVYAERIAFIRAGFDYTKLMVDNISLMKVFLKSNKKDISAADKIKANFDKIKIICDKNPGTINYIRIRPEKGSGNTGSRNTGNLHPDYVVEKRGKRK